MTVGAWLRHDEIRYLLAEVPAGARLLEIGAGQGGLAARLATAFDYTGLEPDEASARVAERRLAAIPGQSRLHTADYESAPIHPPYDVVCAFEVLEHLPDDLGVLREWHSLVARDGWLILSVPAHPDRFGPWDETVGHLRRYARHDLDQLLRACGFDDTRILATGFPLGYATEFVRNRLAQRRPASGSPARRTSASGRLLQSPDHVGSFTRGLTAPFRRVQQRSWATERGIGYVVSARRRS